MQMPQTHFEIKELLRDVGGQEKEFDSCLHSGQNMDLNTNPGRESRCVCTWVNPARTRLAALGAETADDVVVYVCG